MKPLQMAVVAVALLAGSAQAAWAGWSTNNPYRTFNVTGLNYGSQNWEEHYGNKRTGSSTQVRPRLLWRR